MLPHIRSDTPCVIVDTSSTRHVTDIRFVHHSPLVNGQYVYKSMDMSV